MLKMEMEKHCLFVVHREESGLSAAHPKHLHLYVLTPIIGYRIHLSLIRGRLEYGVPGDDRTRTATGKTKTDGNRWVKAARSKGTRVLMGIL